MEARGGGEMRTEPDIAIGGVTPRATDTMPLNYMAMLRRHRNPLDAIFDAMRLEARGRGGKGVRLEHLAARLAAAHQ